MPRPRINKILGHAKCYGCGCTVEVRLQVNKRLYYVCDDRRNGCNEHHKYSPFLEGASDIPGFVPLEDGTSTVPDKDLKSQNNGTSTVPVPDHKVPVPNSKEDATVSVSVEPKANDGKQGEGHVEPTQKVSEKDFFDRLFGW